MGWVKEIDFSDVEIIECDNSEIKIERYAKSRFENGQVCKYDGNGYVICHKSDLRAHWEEYDASGKIVYEKYSLGSELFYKYDKYGRRIKTYTPYGVLDRTRYTKKCEITHVKLIMAKPYKLKWDKNGVCWYKLLKRRPVLRYCIKIDYNGKVIKDTSSRSSDKLLKKNIFGESVLMCAEANSEVLTRLFGEHNT